jgi:glycosyltransferase involved in cell wall biosynthesis
MKILYITCGNGNSSRIGGGFVRTMEISERISKNNKVYFLTSTGGKEVLKNIFNVGIIYEIKSYLIKRPTEFEDNYFTRFLSYLITVFKSLHVINVLPRVDVVYTDSDGFWDVIPAFFYKKKYPEAKWISMNYHKITLIKNNFQSFIISLVNIIIQKISYFFICKYSDVIFVLDTDMGDVIKNYFRKKKNKSSILYVKVGVNIDFIKRIPDQSKKYDAVFLGGLRASKGLYDIVPIWKKVCERKRDAKLIIIGGMITAYKNYLENEIKINGLEGNIIIKGYIPEKEKVIELIKQSRIFIFPSHEEGWGISVTECLACGNPGVLWDLPVYKRIFNEGVVKVEAFNVCLFAEEVCKLLGDGRLFFDLKNKTISAVEKYDWGKIAEQELKILENINKKNLFI